MFHSLHANMKCPAHSRYLGKYLNGTCRQGAHCAPLRLTTSAQRPETMKPSMPCKAKPSNMHANAPAHAATSSPRFTHHSPCTTANFPNHLSGLVLSCLVLPICTLTKAHKYVTCWGVQHQSCPPRWMKSLFPNMLDFMICNSLCHFTDFYRNAIASLLVSSRAMFVRDRIVPLLTRPSHVDEQGRKSQIQYAII